MIKAIYFDLDDTLYNQLESFQLALQHAELQEDVTVGIAVDALYKTVRRHSDRLWEQHVRGEMTLEELRSARAIAAFSDFGRTLTEEDALRLQQQYELEQSRLKLREGVPPLFKKLQERNIQLGIITNGPVAHQMGKIDALGLKDWVEDRYILVSDGIGIAKPDSEVFHFAAKRSGLEPQHLMYVGDAWHNDIAPSYKAGWTSIWLNERRQDPDPKDKDIQYVECESFEKVIEQVLQHCSKDTSCLL